MTSADDIIFQRLIALQLKRDPGPASALQPIRILRSVVLDDAPGAMHVALAEAAVVAEIGVAPSRTFVLTYFIRLPEDPTSWWLLQMNLMREGAALTRLSVLTAGRCIIAIRRSAADVATLRVRLPDGSSNSQTFSDDTALVLLRITRDEQVGPISIELLDAAGNVKSAAAAPAVRVSSPVSPNRM